MKQRNHAQKRKLKVQLQLFIQFNMENEREWQLENERNEKGELIKRSILIRNMFYKK